MICAIAAVDENYGIGYKNKLLCNIKEDLSRFRKLTTNSVVIMGRKTWDSLPKKPLSNRVNIVITNKFKEATAIDGAIFVNMELCKKHIKEVEKKCNIYVIGGSQIYKELLPYCEYIYLTKVYKSFEDVDAYFPNIKSDKYGLWELLNYESTKNQDDIKYQFCIYKNVKDYLDGVKYE